MLTLYIADAERGVGMKNLSQKEAIALMRNLEDSLDPYCGLNEEGKTAFRMAIEALSCSDIPNNSDIISRQQAIDALKEKVFHNLSDEFYGAMQVLDELPSIQPEQRWIPVTEIPPYGKDLMLKLHDRRRGCDCFYYFAMGFYDGREYHTYLFKYQDDHDLEVVGWQLCPWKGEQE